MSFKYINPGYGSLVEVSGGVTVEGNLKSNTGVAMYQPDITAGMLLDEAPANLYGKFDVYLEDNEYFDCRIGLCNDGGTQRNGVKIARDSSYWRFSGEGIQDVSLWTQSRNTVAQFESYAKLKVGKINTIYFRLTSSVGSTRGSYEVWVNGAMFSSSTSSNYINFLGYSMKQLVIASTSPSCVISNIILSDEEIDKKETVIVIPTTVSETTMAAQGNGSYTADTAGQTILQSVDVQPLIDLYGAESEIKGLATIGNPAFRTGSSLSSLIPLEKSAGGVITEYGARELLEDSSAGVFFGRKVTMTLSDISGMKFGWKANGA